jgi:hypothetical protein
MGQLTSHRRTVLLALGLVALAAVVAAPGAADQTERRNITVSDDPNVDYLMTFEDTGNTTIEARNSTGAALQTLDSGNITTQKYTLLDGTPPDASRLVISSERPGVSLRAGNRTAVKSSTSISTALRYETEIAAETNATVLTGPGTPSGAYRDYTQLRDERQSSQTTVKTSVNESRSEVHIVVFASLDDNQTSPDPKLVKRWINKTISPGDAVEALRVVQSNSALVERARVRIKTTDGSTIINETLPDAQTSVGYGAVALDNHSEYRVTVTGINNLTDGPPNYSITKLKSNSPLISINPIEGDSPTALLTLGIGFVAVVMYLRTRD